MSNELNNAGDLLHLQRGEFRRFGDSSKFGRWSTIFILAKFVHTMVQNKLISLFQPTALILFIEHLIHLLLLNSMTSSCVMKRRLSQKVSQFAVLLDTKNQDNFEKVSAALREIVELCDVEFSFASSLGASAFAKAMQPLAFGLSVQLSEGRSTIVKEASEAVSALAKRIAGRHHHRVGRRSLFRPFARLVVPQLARLAGPRVCAEGPRVSLSAHRACERHGHAVYCTNAARERVHTWHQRRHAVMQSRRDRSRIATTTATMQMEPRMS